MAGLAPASKFSREGNAFSGRSLLREEERKKEKAAAPPKNSALQDYLKKYASEDDDKKKKKKKRDRGGDGGDKIRILDHDLSGFAAVGPTAKPKMPVFRADEDDEEEDDGECAFARACLQGGKVSARPLCKGPAGC